jgi:hypothetical protein
VKQAQREWCPYRISRPKLSCNGRSDMSGPRRPPSVSLSSLSDRSSRSVLPTSGPAPSDAMSHLLPDSRMAGLMRGMCQEVTATVRLPVPMFSCVEDLDESRDGGDRREAKDVRWESAVGTVTATTCDCSKQTSNPNQSVSHHHGITTTTHLCEFLGRQLLW